MAVSAALLSVSLIGSVEAEDKRGARKARNDNNCKALPTHGMLQRALKSVAPGDNSGLGFNMWGTIVDRDGIVCAVAYTGKNRGDQWPGSRVISAQKANTANAFSLDGLALSTANLFSAVQPGGSLFGLQESNPVSTDVAYRTPARHFGQRNDPMRGRAIGGVNVFGGGLALYGSNGKVIGALGVSGDTSCADHIISWKTRDALGLDNIPGGVNNGTDNIIFDITRDATGHDRSASGFGHPECGVGDTAEKDKAAMLPTDHPIGGGPQIPMPVK